MDSEMDKVRADLKRLRALLVRATDKQTRAALAESIMQTEGQLRRAEDASAWMMGCESELLRAELRRLHALLAWTHNKQAEDVVVRQIEEAEERLRKIWNTANDR